MAVWAIVVVEATSGSKGNWMANHNLSPAVSEPLYGPEDELRGELEVTVRCGSPFAGSAKESIGKVYRLWFIYYIRMG